MAKTINIISDTTYASKAHGVHTAFLQHVEFCRQVLNFDVEVNSWFSKADVDHHHTLGFYHWFFLLIHPTRRHVVHAHVIFDSLVGSIKLPGVLKLIARSYLKLAYNSADKVVAVSETVRDDLVKNCGIVPGKIVVIKNLVLPQHNAPKVSKTSAKKHLGLRSGQQVVLSVGQIQPRKRFDLFIQLAKALPSIQFVWVGDTIFRKLGANTDEMDKLKRTAPSNLTLAGLVAYDKVADYYQAADAFVLLSDQENHPMAVLEAMNFEVPVLLRQGTFSTNEFDKPALVVADSELNESLISLLNDNKLRAKLIKRSRTYLDQTIIGQAKTNYLKLYR